MEALGINLSVLITQLVSFTVLFLILRKLLFGPISSMLQSRSEKIKESLEAAEKVKNEADESAEKLEKEINSARQEDFNPGAANKKYNPTEAKIKVTQKLWDFGETSAAIKTSGLARTMAEIGVNGAKNQAILKAAQAYIGLKKAFKSNQDIHALTASQVFGLPLKKVTDDFRRKAKAINFGIIYGITQYGLAKQIAVSNQEALDFINSYFKKFPEIKDYMNSTIKMCRKQGYVNNIFGRRIHLRGINDKNFSVRSFQERAAINAPIQGSAADIIRLAMIKIDKILKDQGNKAKMLLQIHDELIFECSKKDENEIKKIIKDSMISISSSEHHMFSIPLEVSINSGNNWGEAH